MFILWWIIVGLVAGWATGKIMRGAGYGVFADIVIGIVGAMVGGFIMRMAGFSGQGGSSLEEGVGLARSAAVQRFR